MSILEATLVLPRTAALCGLSLLVLGACASSDYAVTESPNYDGLLGKSFAESIFKGRQVYRVARETPTIEELENRRSDGCILVFGVRKADDAIEYWRIDSGSGTCLTRTQALNR